jgi:cytochrome o ubiquinol oxidase operon protein cyoD
MEQKDIIENKNETGASLASYVAGFVLSLSLTVATYLFVNDHVASHHGAFSHQTLMIMIVVFALSQCFVQLFFFLHLGHETKPRWKLLVFLFMLLVIAILVGGSLWIMHNLDYNMMHMA